MEHAKKMLLIEPSLIERLNQHSNVDNPIARLETEMKNVLNANMDDRKKSILYLQILSRYLHLVEKERQPFEIPIISKNIELSDDSVKGNTSYKNKNTDTQGSVVAQTSDEEEKYEESTTSYGSPLYSTNQILSLIPKSYTKKGELLLNLISSSKNKISWEDDGTVVIDNEKIPGSNIVDLVNDLLRPLKRNEPIGWENFAKALKDIKIPLTYIGNPKRTAFINKLKLSDLGGYTTDEEFTTPTNKQAVKLPHKQQLKENSTDDEISASSTTKYRKKLRNKLDWEKWSPY